MGTPVADETANRLMADIAKLVDDRHRFHALLAANAPAVAAFNARPAASVTLAEAKAYWLRMLASCERQEAALADLLARTRDLRPRAAAVAPPGVTAALARWEADLAEFLAIVRRCQARRHDWPDDPPDAEGEEWQR